MSLCSAEVSMEEMKRILLKDNRPVSLKFLCGISRGDVNSFVQVTEFWKNRYETEARRCWDVFYKVKEILT